MKTNREVRILRYWRDVEVFNIPSVPKRERKPRLRVAKYVHGDALPWEPGQGGTVTENPHEEWTHAVFLGVTETRIWAKIVVDSACKGSQRLTESDLQQLSGDGWLAAFAVDSAGQIIGDSFVPASFSLGVRRLQAGKQLDGLQGDIQEEIEAFNERCLQTLVGQQEGEGGANDKDCGANQGSRISVQGAIGWEELSRELHEALSVLGDGKPRGNFGVVIKSTLRKRRQIEGNGKADGDVEFLNSFYLEDLDRLIKEAESGRSLGAPLEQYLGAASAVTAREDILRQPRAMTNCVAPEKLTLGRWPARSQHHLMLAQQAAVGETMSRLRDGAGLVAVNGPPGTGKTTLLCDVIADVVVQRAIALAKMEVPAQAFGEKTIVGGLSVFPITPQIVAGTGIVVASNNNTAVENITRELPALAKIADEEHRDAAYFQEVATQVLLAAGVKAPAWGLVAVALGNGDNRRKFASAFFREGKHAAFVPGEPCDIRTVLENAPSAALEQWQTAKRDFLVLLKQVDSARGGFAKVAEAVASMGPLQEEIAKGREAIESLRSSQTTLHGMWSARLLDAERALSSSQAALVDAAEHEQLRKLEAQAAGDRLHAVETELAPRLWDRWLRAVGVTTNRMEHWETVTRGLRATRANAADAWRQALEYGQQCKRAAAEQEKALEAIKVDYQRERDHLDVQLERHKRHVAEAEKRSRRYRAKVETFKTTGAKVLDADFFAISAAEQHLASAWVNPQFDHLRARLFIAALRLHEATLLACRGKAIANLRAVKGMLVRDTPEPISAAHRSLVWDMLFFTVPVVSSTLASFDRLFAGLGEGSLGWLLVDEAGQATPQSVVGALWRSRRAVIIGDPQQIEPVSTVPSAVVAELRTRRALDVLWSPAAESAQSTADRTMEVGAWIGNVALPEAAVWTGLPLRAHRRCIDPMFHVANTIAYDGQMVQANSQRAGALRCALGESAWFDVRGQSSSGQVVPEEMAQLGEILRRLKSDWPTTSGDKPASLFVISPFRKVADECWTILAREGIRNDTWPVDCGTVHRFQGKEADIVLIVLGSAPNRAGAGSRSWAATKPNLLNVALTRAKLRVYVIGSVEDWGTCPYFDVLVDEMGRRERILSVSPNLRGGKKQLGTARMQSVGDRRCIPPCARG